MNPLLHETATGRDWRLATPEQRRAYCAAACPAHVDDEFFHEAIDTMLRGRTQSLEALSLAQIVAMVLSARSEAEPAAES